jgi:hypothetical protein
MPAASVSGLVVSHPGAGPLPSDVESLGQYPGNIEDSKIGDVARPSLLKDKQQLLDVLKGWFRADSTHSAQWRVDAKKWYEFRAGNQWGPEDRQVLNAASRPQITFNRMLTILKAVAGMEINGRHEVHYIPRHNENTSVNELLTGAGKWLTDSCDAEDEESQAFEDVCTAGLGFTEHRLDYEFDNRGMYVEEKIDPLEMYWDRNAQRKNMIDARRMWRVKKMPLADAMALFRGKDRHALDATWAVGTDMDATAKTIEEKRKREENTTDVTYDDMYEVTLVNGMWWEREVYWMVADPVSNKTMELSDQEYKTFAARHQMLNKSGQDMKFMAVEMSRRVYKEVFIGGEILSMGNGPLGNQFKWTCITGEYDRTAGSWFGLVKTMMDPQMWANKWLSQSLHILNSTAKGGIMAEMDAFEDVREAEDKWASPDNIVWAKRGALSGDKPKILPRPGSAFPQGHIQLMEFAITAIRDVTGINLELLGLRDQNQPGVVEMQRKQAGMTVLATLFDSLRRFRKLGGRIRLHVIQNYLSDGRLIRVVGPQGAQAIPLMKDRCTGDYDVVIEDAPTSPNMKEQNWLVISSLLPAFKDQLMQNPQLAVKVLEYSPLPSAMISDIAQLLQSQAPQQQQMQNMQQSAATAKINKDQAQAELFLAQAKKQESTAMYDIAISMHQFQKAQSDNDYTAAKAAHERVKAAVAAITPIPHPPNSDKEKAHEALLQMAKQQHERVAQATDQAHEKVQQVGQQRFDLLHQLLEQQHEKQMATQQQAADLTQAAMPSSEPAESA